MNRIKKSFQYGEKTVTLETGAIARQADGSCLVSMGDTVVLVTVVGQKEASPGKDFFPLTVNYQERFYAAGKMPGGFMKREGRPGTHEILASRLIDRPIRPLFPEGFINDVQVIATVMSLDPQISGDIPAMLGASAALAISGIPFNGPIAGARVGYKDGNYILNPSAEQLSTSMLDLVVAGTEHAVLMVESSAQELNKDIMLGAIMYGHKEMQAAIKAIKELAAEAGKPRWSWQPQVAHDEALSTKVESMAKPLLDEAYTIVEKQKRHARLDAIREEIVNTICISSEDENVDEDLVTTVKSIFGKLEEKLMRDKVVLNKVRLDGRDTKTVRPITIDLGVLPRTHGSACFTRGETQALVIATLGTDKDAQIIDIPSGESSERFMLHYNFAPFCTGEIGMLATPKRREIGHGTLAKRALQSMLPDKTEFPYVIRVVSEITASNGSSSMASVCGASLALMDAGVPIKRAVAGIAMGLIKEGEHVVILSDILGDEDHMGDMDFKVAGTINGITALQMDIKIDGITESIMSQALAQAEEGRLHILSIMQTKIDHSREQVSDYAPRIMTIKINPEKIRDVIGKGGVTIRGIIEETGATIDVDDSGIVTVAAVDRKAGQAALDRIIAITAEPEVGKIYEGKVVKITDFGAFVNIMPNRDGLVHISQIANKRVNKVTDYLHEGQMVKVKVVEVDSQGKIRLSMKDVEGNERSE